MARPRNTSIAIAAAFGLLATLSFARAQDAEKPWGPAPVTTTSESVHFRVACHFDTARLAIDAVAAAEPVWSVTDALLEGRAESKGKLEIHLYRGAADFVATDQRITGGKFARNLAFTKENEIASHIAMQPEHDDSVFARAGLSAVTLRTVAHEAVHAVLYASMPNHGDHPSWLAEGLATYIADRGLVKAGLAAAPEIAPMNSTRMVWVKGLLASDALPSPRAILETDLDDVSFDNRYAVWWLFARFLAETENGDRLRSVIDTAWGIGGGTGYRQRLAAAVEEAWGKKTLDGMERAFSEYVNALRPEWEEVSRSLAIRGDTWTQMAFSDTNTLAWHTAPVGRPTYSIKGSAEILYSTNPQMNLLLSRTEVGFLMVAFRANSGVTLFRYTKADEAWENVGWMDAPEVQIGREFPFTVSIDGQKITLTIADQSPLMWTLDDIDLTGPWGVGVQSAGAGVWRGVTLK
jgi:hypothetical protein